MQNQKTIGIVTFKHPDFPCWDPDSINNGITGSEEAVIYMAESLANLGYKVIVFGDPPPNSRYISPDNNPIYVSCNAPIKNYLDIVISWRMPQLAKTLRKIAKKVYFWPHDILFKEFYQLTDEEIHGFDDVLWLSEWHRKQYISIKPAFAKYTKIFGNGIKPEQFQPVKERENPYSCIYSSCWRRGLELLLDIWPNVIQHYPKATLDVYYGAKALKPEFREKIHKKMAKLDNVYYHGLVGHEELARAFQKTSIWTYPCIYPLETFCITALKAQLAGAFPVVNEICALPETVRHGLKCTNPKWYLSLLLTAMQNAEKITLEDRRKMGEFVLEQYTWEKIARKWKSLFDSHSI